MNLQGNILQRCGTAEALREISNVNWNYVP
jgi:hypothetical protein